jgi:nucleotide-binding universal stress UspA family protein
MTETRDTRDRTEVVVGIDGSEPSKRALRWAARYAKAMGETVHAVIAWEPPALLKRPGQSATPFSARTG